MIFMKILHYAVFYASKSVANYLYAQEIDPNTVHMNDYKFMEKIFFIIVSMCLITCQVTHLGLKPRLSINQFFKYGFAEQKMMMCVDTIKAVKSLHKDVRREQQLSSTRKAISRPASSERFVDSNVKLVAKSKNLAEL